MGGTEIAYMLKITLLLLATSLTGLNTPAELFLQPIVNSQDREEVVENQTVVENTDKEIVENYFADAPVMVEIARCESSFRHTNSNGEVLRGIANNKDVGIMQINEYFHLEKSVDLNIDIYSIEGNLEFARYLYEKQGTQPWKASKKCWAAA